MGHRRQDRRASAAAIAAGHLQASENSVGTLMLLTRGAG